VKEQLYKILPCEPTNEANKQTNITFLLPFTYLIKMVKKQKLRKRRKSILGKLRIGGDFPSRNTFYIKKMFIFTL
jgi:hypothetical protein